MELKLIADSHADMRENPFNRTTMELKLIVDEFNPQLRGGF